MVRGQELRYAPPVGAMLGQSPKDAPVAHTALGDLGGYLI